MDLASIPPSDFEDALHQEESETMALARVRSTRALQASAAMVAFAGSMTIGTVAVMALITAIAPTSGLLFSLLLFGGSITVMLASLMAAWRYLHPSERRQLNLFEPDAKRFILAHWDDRQGLLDEARGFNGALDAFRRLPSRAGEDEVDQAVAANLSGRQQRLKERTERYLAEFRSATSEARARLVDTSVAAKRRHRRVVGPLDAYQDKVRRLAELERRIDVLPETAPAGCTIDVSLHVAARQRREELELERARLIALGLKPKPLPKPRVAEKLLPA